MISIIIPTYNEAASIGQLVHSVLYQNTPHEVEVIVCDGGSTDDTLPLAEAAGAKCIVSPGKSRALQMNYGAAQASGDMLYFIHADTLPPKSYVTDIYNALVQGYQSGRYRTRFDSSHFLLKLNAFFTRFDWHICSGGDQTLFITRKLFESINGFDESMFIMEDYDIVSRVRKIAPYCVMEGYAVVSARKYETNSWLKVQLANKKIVNMYRKGASQKDMVETYKQMLVYR
ncbi:MAG: TIGR04283 family arsenosugar biosynthesis glycosyltransferase [Chitinophagaceae bacterium]|nr:TIGR04283 family arsenosugar biosynthesis glycosyltransferase [Chitinophagaceae bacterium]